MIVLSEYIDEKEMYIFQTTEMLYPLAIRLSVQSDGSFYSSDFERIFLDLESLEKYLLDILKD